MTCPYCGNENPDNSIFCTVCNSPLTTAPTASYGTPIYSDTSYSVPKKKSATGPIIAILTVIVLLAVGACYALFGLGWKYNGTYELYSVSSMGMTFTMDQLTTLLGDEDSAAMSAEIKISCGKYTVSGDIMGNSGQESGKIKFSGKDFTIDTDMSGHMEGDQLIIEQDGAQLIFKKK